MKLLTRFCSIVLLLCAGNLLAAELEPALQTNLKTADADHWFSVIIKLYNPRDIQALDQRLHAEKALRIDRHRIVMHALHQNAEETQGPVIARLQRMKTQGLVEGYTAFWIENLIVVYGKTDAILALASDPAVESIGYNFKASLIEPVPRGPVRGGHPGALDTETIPIGQRATGAVRVNRELGITGLGVLIAGLDTGVDGNHPALHDRWRGLSHPVTQCWLDLLGGSPNFPTDNGSHGTHTMGTMTGREIRTNGDTITVGAAPQAQWISCNAINQGVGRPFDQDILDAFQWLADPDSDSTTVDDAPDVVQNSWGVYANIGGDPTYTTCFSTWNTVILNCEAGGTVVIWSAGNEASSGLRSPAKFELSPTDMFSVGAVDLSVDSIAPYPIANFSSLGPSGCAPDVNAIKPEICAPGVNVFSSIPGGQYSDAWSGTSMAGPHISGIVALMRQACPNCDPQTIKEALISTAVRTGYVTPPATENNTFGNGFVDAYAAVVQVSSLGRVDGYITATNGDPLPRVQVQAVGRPNTTLTNNSGYYNLVVTEPGTYSMNYTKFGYVPVTHDNVVVTTGDTTHLNITMAVAPSGAIAGTVVLQSGFPAQGAQVSFPGTPLDTVSTDANGHFVHAIPAGTYATHIELRVNYVPPRLFSRDTTVTIVLADTTRFSAMLNVTGAEPGPVDGMGYQAYDRQDRGLPCPYDWVELNPANGGNGTPFTYPSADAAVFLPTPFPMFFYGWEAETLTVNCNGWMLPGVHSEAGRINTRIPQDSAGDPPGIIAPLWNDFDRGNGALQFSKFDTTTGRWIFQFVNQRLLPNNNLCNWEVQILDPAFSPTLTGDCEIHYLYGAVSNVIHSTVGIENPAENTGIQVMRDTVSSWAWPIENGSAIRLTTGHATTYGNATVVLGLNPPPNDGTSRTVRVGGRAVTAPTPNPLVLDSVPAEVVSGIVNLPGYERARVDQVTILAGQMNTVYMDAWRLDPVRNLGGRQMNGVVTLHWTQPSCLDYAPNASITYTVFRNDTIIAQLLADSSYADVVLPNHATVTYKVAVQYTFERVMSAPFVVTIDLAVAETPGTLPTSYSLYPNYPNPFNPDTRIRLDVPSNVTGRLQVFDLEGRLVKTLYSGNLSAGRYQYNWNSQDEQGRGVASGLYFCRFSSAQYTATQKMMLVK